MTDKPTIITHGSLMDIACEENEYSKSGYFWHLVIYNSPLRRPPGIINIIYESDRNHLILNSLLTRHRIYHEQLEKHRENKKIPIPNLIGIELLADGPFLGGVLKFYKGHEPIKILEEYGGL